MGLEIYWTEFADSEFENIFNYYSEKAGPRIARKLTNGIYNETLKLKSQPEIGQIEELLQERNQEFRYLVYKSYKIIYWLNHTKNQIEIVDIFDTRQNPQKIERTE
jgi:plasmid stabilization system protein ParE